MSKKPRVVDSDSEQSDEEEQCDEQSGENEECPCNDLENHDSLLRYGKE